MTNLSLNSKDDFEKVLELYGKTVYRLAYARTGSVHDAEDVLQEVFLRYAKNEITFNDENHRKAWLLKVTSNCSKSLVTSSWNRRRYDADIESGAVNGFDTISNAAEDAERNSRNKLIRSAVLKLPEKYRAVIHLFYFEGMSVEEISRIEEISISSVKTRLHRARKILKEHLEGVGINEWD